MKVNISIVVPTLNRTNSLVRLIESLRDQITNAVELIIVEQGSNSSKVITKFAKRYKLKVTHKYIKTKNTAVAKNIGIGLSKGKYIIFYDDDVVVHKDSVKRIINNFKDSTIGCVAGRAITVGQKLELDHDKVGRISAWSGFTGGFSSLIRQEVDTPVGCNMAFPRKLLNEVGGFDERYTGAIREESDLALRIKKKRFKVIFDPTTTVTHMREPVGGGRKTEGGRLHWNFHYFSNEMYFFLKHGNHLMFPIFLLSRLEYMLRCMFGFGREVSFRSLMTPYYGMRDGVQKYKEWVNDDHRN